MQQRTLEAAVCAAPPGDGLAESERPDVAQAYRLIFRGKTIAAVWYWLERLAVPLRDRRDVLQEVFFAAFRSFPTYDPGRARPERWLNRITVNTASHYHERAQHKREVLTPEPVIEEVDPAPTAHERIEAEQDRLMLYELLDDIDPHLRSVLIAHDIDEVPMVEIAARHGLPLSTAYKWRARALEALREAYRCRARERDRDREVERAQVRDRPSGPRPPAA